MGAIQVPLSAVLLMYLLADATTATPAGKLDSTIHTSTSQFTLSFPTDFSALQQDDLLMDGFKESIAAQVMRATNVSAQQVAVARVRPGSAIADVYVSAPTTSTEEIEKNMQIIGDSFDSQFKTAFQVSTTTPISVSYASTTTNTPGEDAAEAAAAASHQVAMKAGTIVGIEIAAIGLAVLLVGAFVVRRRKQAAAAAIAQQQQRPVVVEVRSSIL